MSTKTSIEWTDATWNPVVGCSPISAGCEKCYASRMAGRFHQTTYAGYVEHIGNGTCGAWKWNGKAGLISKALDRPLHWRKPRRIFVNSMGDLFHESVPDEWIDRVFAVMALCPQHTFQVLTKRPERMMSRLLDGPPNWDRAIDSLPNGNQIWVTDDCHLRVGLDCGDDPVTLAKHWPLPNVWLGVSVEDQKTADARIPLLLRTPAALRFVSCEPLLGAIIFEPEWIGDCPLCDGRGHYYVGSDIAGCNNCQGGYLHWIIAGAETGPGARPAHPDWFRSLRDQCQAAGVPYFFKGFGEWAEYTVNGPNGYTPQHRWIDLKGTVHNCGLCEVPSDDCVCIRRDGKRAAGRRLDGHEHSEIPE